MNGDEEGGAEALVVADTGVEDTPAEPKLYTEEEIAERMGWSPKDKWRGRPEAWKPASEYIDNTRYETKNLRQSVKRTEQAVERLTQAQDAAITRAIERERERLTAEFEQAVDDGDKQAATKATRELNKLEKQETKAQSQLSSDAQDFVSRHSSWFGKDEEATAYAVSVTERLNAQGKSIPEQLEAAEAAVRKRFPEHFEEQKPAPKPAPGVNAPNSRSATGAPRAKGFADLPAEAKAQWQKFDTQFKRSGFKDGYPQSEYAAEYWANKAA